MKAKLLVGVALIALGAAPAQAHRLDEYLQAVTVAVGHDRMQAQIRLTPGVVVARIVLAAIDTDANGVISAVEERAYAARVLRDLSFTIDGASLPIHLVAWKYPDAAAMQEGRGEIVVDFDAPLPPGGTDRQLTMENRHQRQIAVYLVNALAPTDPAIRIAEQTRNNAQSYYRLDFAQAAAGAASETGAGTGWSGVPSWIAAVLVGLTVPIAVAALRRRRQLRRPLLSD